jgi:hypothetical protein
VVGVTRAEGSRPRFASPSRASRSRSLTGWEESGDVTVRSTYPFKIDMFGLVLYDGLLQSRTTERVE